MALMNNDKRNIIYRSDEAFKLANRITSCAHALAQYTQCTICARTVCMHSAQPVFSFKADMSVDGGVQSEKDTFFTWKKSL